jgi:hypothetical protein
MSARLGELGLNVGCRSGRREAGLKPGDYKWVKCGSDAELEAIARPEISVVSQGYWTIWDRDRKRTSCWASVLAIGE